MADANGWIWITEIMLDLSMRQSMRVAKMIGGMKL